MNVFENVGCLIKPKKLFFDTEDDKDKAGELRNKEECGQIIPLDSVLKVFLELPSVFDTMRDYYLNLMQQADSINNIVQTNFWKSKIIEYPDRIIFPLFAYEDGYETGNPLDSHAGVYNLNGIYIIFPCIPPEFISKLDNISLAQLCHADDAANVNKKNDLW